MSRHGARRRAIAAVVGMAAAAGTAGLALADAPADFTVSGGRLAPGETATFTAHASCAAPVTCTWAFGDGAGATGGEVTHAYADPGTRTVTLTLDDPDDPAEPSVHTQSVTVDARPVAAFSMSPQNPRKNDTVTFDATASSDPDGDPLTVIAVNHTGPLPNNTVTINPDFTVHYTSIHGWFGQDYFEYTVSDGKGGTATGTIAVYVYERPPY